MPCVFCFSETILHNIRNLLGAEPISSIHCQILKSLFADPPELQTPWPDVYNDKESRAPSMMTSTDRSTATLQIRFKRPWGFLWEMPKALADASRASLDTKNLSLPKESTSMLDAKTYK
ncbi:unnamed protein product [Allacma fusca]|uniref:Uncharacterized protein n=1 Tax=Allacma fusca TaxID=39272 RepID=A0A8J2PK52_9HEXA|nr:unnamed protein product [Allacma fusca]